MDLIVYQVMQLQVMHVSGVTGESNWLSVRPSRSYTFPSMEIGAPFHSALCARCCHAGTS